MLFNSYEFIFIFLPVALLIFFAAVRSGHGLAIGWLVVASLFFYSWWNPVYLLLIISSMVVNFGFGELLGKTLEKKPGPDRKLYLALGVCFNLGLLAYFKYAGFIADNLGALFHADIDIGHIALPLAISFFTFQQIAYLVDAYKGITHEYKFLHYALFVTFFPQLIAGPIVHHKEMLPQFMQRTALTPRIENIVIGVTIFSIGLFKKAVIADGVAPFASPVFAAAAQGDSPTFFVAWGGALAYTMQLYFDFSGYSDMAIGGARMFGIRLPLNFHSPYKATNIVEFWRRWHITLSRFLRDYLYIPLGGNRKGKVRRYLNLMITMLLGGLWHGAGWTFVIWGGLHGFYLVANHAWNRLCSKSKKSTSKLGKFLAWATTFIAVIIGWVFFRAESTDAAMAILEGMAGINGVSIPNGILARLGGVGEWLQSLGVEASLGGGTVIVSTYLWVGALLLVITLMPNTQQIMSRFDPALSPYSSEDKNEIRPAVWLGNRLTWRPAPLWAASAGLIAAMGILALTSISEFLYFQF